MRFDNSTNYINEDGLECDVYGNYKRDYEDTSISFDELALPRNKKEFNRWYKRSILEEGIDPDRFSDDQLPGMKEDE